MLDILSNVGYTCNMIETEVSDMWTEEEINAHSVYLDRQEQIVLKALEAGLDNIEDVKSYVTYFLQDADLDYVEMVYNMQTNPERKVPLEVL